MSVVTLQQLTDLIQGEMLGDPRLAIRGARSLHEAGEGDITFLENERHLGKLRESKASAAIVPLSVSHSDFPIIRVQDPLMAFVAIVQHLQGRPIPSPRGVDPLANVHPTVQLGCDPSIYPFAYIDEGAIVGDRCRIHSGVAIGRDCKIGDDVTIFPNAVIYDGIELGDRVIIHANAVIGADGFGYRFQRGRHVKVPQLGTVIVGMDVEIGALSAVDRGTFSATRIGEGTKIDNLVQIAHNCQIGRHNAFASQVGIAGSCTTGDYVVMAGQVGLADHVRIGERSVIGGKSGVTGDLDADGRYLGWPAVPEGEQKRTWSRCGNSSRCAAISS